MTTKLTKTASEVSTAQALATALEAHVQMLTDADGYPVRVARVVLVEEYGVIVARAVGGYALPGAERDNLEAKANKAHQIRKIGL